MVGYLDRFSRQDSVCHRIPTSGKLVLAFAVILGSLLLPPPLWPAQVALVGLLLAALSLARIPFPYVTHRLVRFLPFVLLFALSFWLGSRARNAEIVILNLVLRTVVCFLAALWLVNVSPFDALLATLGRVGLPRVAVTLLAFMYRYLFVVFDELDRMRQAREARSFGQISLARQWSLRGQMVGMLLVRGLSRAERVYGAMCARGWEGTLRRLEDLPPAPYPPAAPPTGGTPQS